MYHIFRSWTHLKSHSLTIDLRGPSNVRSPASAVPFAKSISVGLQELDRARVLGAALPDDGPLDDF